MTSQTTTIDLHHDIRGTGPLLVLVHGLSESIRSWDPLMDDLVVDHRVLRVDLRGHGASPKADSYRKTDMADDIAPLVGDDLPIVVGHSLGGMVATAYASRRPTRGVVNIDAPLDTTAQQQLAKRIAPALRTDRYRAVATELLEALRGPLSGAAWDRLNAGRRIEQDVILGVWEEMIELDPDEYANIVKGWADTVDVPYLALCGTDPGPPYAAWLANWLPQAQLEVWNDHGHYPHLLAPDRFTRRLRAFEDDLAGARPGAEDAYASGHSNDQQPGK